MTTSRRRTSLRRNTSYDTTGCVLVHYRAARTVVNRALKASGLWHSYESRAETGGTPRYVFQGTLAQYKAFDAYLDALPPADLHGIDVYCD